MSKIIENQKIKREDLENPEYVVRDNLGSDKTIRSLAVRNNGLNDFICLLQDQKGNKELYFSESRKKIKFNGSEEVPYPDLFSF